MLYTNVNMYNLVQNYKKGIAKYVTKNYIYVYANRP